MKKNINIYDYIAIAVVAAFLVVATSFLMLAADEPIREAGCYLPLIFGALGTWAAGKAGIVQIAREERAVRRARAAA